MSLKLDKIPSYAGPDGPVVLIIMDGVGIGKYADGDFVRAAWKPHLDHLMATCPHTTLKAHGTAVGMPSDDDMGNSEIGHNAIGCGRVYDQGASLVAKAVAAGSLYDGATWQALIANVQDHRSTLHFIGLFSDGNVHSHLDHLRGMLVQAKKEGVPRVRIHALLDGRDVPPTSALDYVAPFEAFLADLNADGTVDYAIASGGGRMKVTMDRYQADWRIVERGWKTHVLGQADELYPTATAAIEALRSKTPGILDQDLPPFVIGQEGQPIGPIVDHDSVILFNFRGDRAIELTHAFEQDDFTAFDRVRRPDVLFAGMMQYDGDAGIPARFLVEPPRITRTMGEYLAAAGQRQLAISETQKFGHVTYFFNGNRAEKFNDALEDYVEIPSDQVPFEERPWMKSAEITDALIEAIGSGRYDFIRVNYPNGDMVGHTGIFPAVQIAVESVDLAIGRLLPAIQQAGGILVISADHGNSDDMVEHAQDGTVKLDPTTGQPKARTAHSLNPVPAIIVDPTNAAKITLADTSGLGISSLAATCLNLLGYQTPEGYDASLVTIGG
ncbi:MAG: 2,3-bisphosphoglycerate-independent phosphoglycerate mutase [Kiritimatiellae bacterium]|nr:2,3-bisphosphoglycerate-independent phosphoglycerate mutase [Kiritimatiellia bacterium]MDD4341685.1 2,3-bisphosphoglycerate-independent phosphoglycerate mutase [Kiritimatiellia bacterium]